LDARAETAKGGWKERGEKMSFLIFIAVALSILLIIGLAAGTAKEIETQDRIALELTRILSELESLKYDVQKLKNNKRKHR
jgi:hypothetical protein